MCDVDYEPCDVWREAYRTARKEHTCSSCSMTIRSGERYRSLFYVSEGEAGNECACLTCAAGIDAFVKEHGAGPIPSGFARALDECIADGDDESERVWKPMLAALDARIATAHEARK